MVTGTVFVDLSAAYDTISHKLLLNKIYRMTSDSQISSGTCSPIDDTLLNSTAKRVDGGIRRMVFPKEVCYHLCSSTFTQMTNQYTRTLGVSSTQTTCVLRHRMHHLRRPNQPSAQHWRLLREEPFVCQHRQDTGMRIPPEEQKSKNSENVPKISAYLWWNCQATHNRLQIEINYYPDSLLFVSAGFLPRVSSQRLN